MGNIENRQVPTTFSQHFVDIGLSNPLWNSMEVEGQGRRKKGKVCPPKTFPICQRLDGGEDGCLFCLGHASSFIRLRTSILSSVSFKYPPRLSVVDMGGKREGAQLNVCLSIPPRNKDNTNLEERVEEFGFLSRRSMFWVLISLNLSHPCRFCASRITSLFWSFARLLKRETSMSRSCIGFHGSDSRLQLRPKPQG
ncbi:hypothetical protein CABS01_10929 [Colletotrichum abscissum]|uniref:uncharacterized protein n=1 Tax=Colletotrichum abscissum TaxID=1671311 RepID=UPI0027D5323F|nr:uncharacterized protein CABS01_10929 [Colletotrichum abscissum]KAK1496780.1 hypothetical protein CABS01_10929 [Colletotrichum abscissum]